MPRIRIFGHGISSDAASLRMAAAATRQAPSVRVTVHFGARGIVEYRSSDYYRRADSGSARELTFGNDAYFRVPDRNGFFWKNAYPGSGQEAMIPW